LFFFSRENRKHIVRPSPILANGPAFLPLPFLLLFVILHLPLLGAAGLVGLCLRLLPSRVGRRTGAPARGLLFLSLDLLVASSLLSA